MTESGVVLPPFLIGTSEIETSIVESFFLGLNGEYVGPSCSVV